MNIYLIGYRCTGKTTTGKYLAENLNRPFIDADTELIKEQGKTVKEIVSVQGWGAFRSMEKDVLKRLSMLRNHVVSTGGGVVLDNDNIDRMKSTGVVIWLNARPETVLKRIMQDEKTGDLRPALTDKKLKDEIEETIAARKPFYEKAMDYLVNTDDKRISDVCDKLTKLTDIITATKNFKI
ncbi:MAG: shikimate kinase [Desulfobacterales bacterium]|nr:shikimate kinase [Desulfobacterales bacterium]